MRTVAITILALIGGFFTGLVLSEIIGIVGFFAFGTLIGFKFLPFISAFAAAGAAVAVKMQARRRSA